MIRIKQLEADIQYDTVTNFPLYFQFTVLFFFGSLIFFCISPKMFLSGRGMTKKTALFESDGSAGAMQLSKHLSISNGTPKIASGGDATKNTLLLSDGSARAVQLPKQLPKLLDIPRFASGGDMAKKTPLIASDGSAGAVQLPRLNKKKVSLKR